MQASMATLECRQTTTDFPNRADSMLGPSLSLARIRMCLPGYLRLVLAIACACQFGYSFPDFLPIEAKSTSPDGFASSRRHILDIANRAGSSGLINRHG